MSHVGQPKKEGVETKPAPGTPAKGPAEQYLARRPFRGVGKYCFCRFKSPRAQVGCFPGSNNLTLTRRSVFSKLRYFKDHLLKKPTEAIWIQSPRYLSLAICLAVPNWSHELARPCTYDAPRPARNHIETSNPRQFLARLIRRQANRAALDSGTQRGTKRCLRILSLR